MAEQEYGICRVAIAPLRAEGSDRAEIASQLLFGEEVKILQKAGAWWLVKGTYEGYAGWVDFRQLGGLSAAAMHASRVSYLVPAGLSNIITAEDGSSYYLLSGSRLPNYADGSCQIGDQVFTVGFEPVLVDFERPSQNVEQLAKFYLNAPYLWGGRTLFGIDCSGFVQIVHKLMGVKLLRDASQQALEGEVVDFLASARLGDVAFFDNAEGKITHVGILLSNKEIIHSSAKVKIDPIDDQGIFSKELNKYTHHLRIIKRYI
ncbi:MAG: hydrolase [Pedobacter sp.]|nr:MAG: hydrolase [Pedobacter sp.]